MSISKAWSWESADKEGWLEPCEESRYYAEKWYKEGRRSVLDLGCGLGRHSLLFAETGFTVTAADLSDYAVSFVRDAQKKRGLDFRTVKCDMLSLPFADCAFDCVWAYHTLSHTDSAGFSRIISEIRRVLRPEGAVYFDVCSKETWMFTQSGFPHIDANTLVVQGGEEDGIPHFFTDLDELEHILDGFDIIKIRHIDDCYSNGRRQTSRHYFVYANARKDDFEPDYSNVIGKSVQGEIDRPIGSVHPRCSDLIYPVNYGYVKGIRGGDGHWQDVYLLGVKEPVHEFEARVIGVYHRYNDCEDKWICAPDGMAFSDNEILESIHFQEKYFTGKLYT